MTCTYKDFKPDSTVTMNHCITEEPCKRGILGKGITLYWFFSSLLIFSLLQLQSPEKGQKHPKVMTQLNMTVFIALLFPL